MYYLLKLKSFRSRTFLFVLSLVLNNTSKFIWYPNQISQSIIRYMYVLSRILTK